MWLTLLQLVVGLALVLFFAERLVGAVVGSAVGFGVSAFVVSVLFVGFDPENLAVGAAAAHRGIAGFALGSIVGAAMVAVALAFGLTAIITPMEFQRVPGHLLVVPVLAVLVLGGLAADGWLSRVDGGLLLLGFAAAAIWLIRLARRGLDIVPAGEVAETLEHAHDDESGSGTRSRCCRARRRSRRRFAPHTETSNVCHRPEGMPFITVGPLRRLV